MTLNLNASQDTLAGQVINLRWGVDLHVCHTSSRRDVPAERLYKVLWVAEKGGSRRGFGITRLNRMALT
jgi:hypothetical protein